MNEQEIYLNYRFSFELECTKEGRLKVLKILREALEKDNLAYHKLKIKKKIYKR